MSSTENGEPKANTDFIAGGRHRPLVAYSCGAYGASLADGSEFSGGYCDHMTEEQLMDFHRSRLDPVKGHPAIDMLAFETIPCLKV